MVKRKLVKFVENLMKLYRDLKAFYYIYTYILQNNITNEYCPDISLEFRFICQNK